MKGKYSQFFAIINKRGLTKEDAVEEFTEGRTRSLKDLTDGEFRELMIRLQRQNTPPPGDQMRKKIISIARQMGWTYRAHPMLPLKADMQRIDQWCVKYGRFHKKLNDHTPAELAIIVSVFEEVFKSYLKGLAV